MKHLGALGLVACLFACSSDANPVVVAGGSGGSGTGTRMVVVTDALAGATTDGGSRPPIGVGTVNPDAALTDAGGTGGMTGADAMVASCDLVAQNCDSQHACYRKLPNQTSCETPGFAAEVTTCAADTTCMKGMVCVAGESGIAGCLTICDPQLLPCPNRRACLPLRGYEPAGYCEL